MPVTTPSRGKLPKELRDLQRRLKDPWRLVRGRGGHYRIEDDQGNSLQIDGKTWVTSGTWGEGHNKQPMMAQLRAAGVLLTNKGTEYAPPEQAVSKRQMKLAEMVAARQVGRDAVAKALDQRLRNALSPLGDPQNVRADIVYAASQLAADAGKPTTPDLLHSSLGRVLGGMWVTPVYQEVWARLCEAMETSSNRVEMFFTLVRRARGLPEKVVADHKLVVPQGEDGEWAFEVVKLPLDKFMVDHSYQRPTPWAFVRKTAATFDESLVGTIDVAERGKGAVFAILDGQCRFEACKLVGKKSIWASIYRGLSLAEEAAFFLHKNQDRKAIHPYYLWKARLASGDPETVEIDKLVTAAGYRVWMSTTDAQRDGSIASIAVLHTLYGKPVYGDNGEATSVLLPTLRVLDATRGRPHGQAGNLLLGLGEFFARYPEPDEAVVKETLALQGADWMIGRGREIKLQNSIPLTAAICRALALEYNHRLPRGGKKLSVWA